jgi:hypothetical protein
VKKILIKKLAKEKQQQQEWRQILIETKSKEDVEKKIKSDSKK